MDAEQYFDDQREVEYFCFNQQYHRAPKQVCGCAGFGDSRSPECAGTEHAKRETQRSDLNPCQAPATFMWKAWLVATSPHATEPQQRQDTLRTPRQAAPLCGGCTAASATATAAKGIARQLLCSVMAGRVARAQAGVRHIITGFFLGAGASGGGEAREGRAASWQATQHRNRLQACGRALTPSNHERHRKFFKGLFVDGCPRQLLGDEQTGGMSRSIMPGGGPGKAGGCLCLIPLGQRSGSMGRCTTLAGPSGYDSRMRKPAAQLLVVQFQDIFWLRWAAAATSATQ